MVVGFGVRSVVQVEGGSGNTVSYSTKSQTVLPEISKVAKNNAMFNYSQKEKGRHCITGNVAAHVVFHNMKLLSPVLGVDLPYGNWLSEIRKPKKGGIVSETPT